MENKELSTAKDNVAKKFLKDEIATWDDLLNYDKFMLVDEVAIEYNRIMSESNLKEFE